MWNGWPRNAPSALQDRLGLASATTPERQPSETAARLLSDPARLRDTVVAHLGELWERYLAPEWTRVERQLQASVGYLLRSAPGSGVAPAVDPGEPPALRGGAKRL